jgi:hypothetical protein
MRHRLASRVAASVLFFASASLLVASCGPDEECIYISCINHFPDAGSRKIYERCCTRDETYKVICEYETNDGKTFDYGGARFECDSYDCPPPPPEIAHWCNE